MLQHRQVIKAGDICSVNDEHVLASSAEEDLKNKDFVKFNVFEALSGCTTQATQFPAHGNPRNSRVVTTVRHIFQYDYIGGQFTIVDRTSSEVITQLNKKPPTNAFISISCASQLPDGMFFYAYGSNSPEESSSSSNTTFSSIQAILVGENKAVMSLAMHTDYKGCGFQDKNPGRIVSLHCHPSKQFLFVVYAKGAVQVWSYSKCYQHLQQSLNSSSSAGGGYGGGSGGGDWGAAIDTASVSGANLEPADDNESDAGDDAASESGDRSVHGSVHGSAQHSSVGGGGGGGGNSGSVRSVSSKVRTNTFLSASNKQIQAKLLKAVASFAIPSAKQLMRLDPELEGIQTTPSSFRLDARGRFAAVVWSERVLCVYDIYTLLMLAVLQKPLNNSNSKSSAAQAVNVVQLSIFGAFPCRALPHPGGVEYTLGPIAFHPTAQVVLVSVLRHRQTPRMELQSTAVYRNNMQNSGGTNSGGSSNTGGGTSSTKHRRAAEAPTTTLPLSTLLYAVSLAAHQPILSAVGSYDLGMDVDVAAFGASASINWRPRSIDCTPHSGLIGVSFNTITASTSGSGGTSGGSGTRGGSSVLDYAMPVEDIHFDANTTSVLSAEDSVDIDLAYGDKTTTTTATSSSAYANAYTTHPTLHTRSTHLMVVYGLSPAWLRSVGLTVGTTPIMSTLPTPPDVYVYGEGVMSSRSVYVQSNSGGVSASTIGSSTVALSLTAQPPSPSALTLRSFTITDTTTNSNTGTANTTNSTNTSTSTSAQVSDLYPLLLALRAAYDGADEGLSVNSISVCYHLFRTHWVHPSVSLSSGGTSTGTGASNSASSAEGSSAAYLGLLPALLTSTLLSASAEQSASFLTLSEDAHLSLTGWDSDADTSGAHVLHTLCPLRIVTKECNGVSSLVSGWLGNSDNNNTSSTSGEWDAILIATVRRSIASSALYSVAENADINSTSANRTLPVVCYMKYDAVHGLRVAYTTHRDAAYWLHSSGSNASASGITYTSSTVSNDPEVSVLALARGGLQVQHLTSHSQLLPTVVDNTNNTASNSTSFHEDAFGGSSDPFAAADPTNTASSTTNPTTNTTSTTANTNTIINNTKRVASVTATYTLGAEMSSVYTAPAGAPNVVIFASASPVTYSGANSKQYVQSLHATHANPSVADFAAVGKEKQCNRGYALALQRGEVVLEVVWQTMPSVLGKHGSSSAVRTLQQVWLLDGTPLLAVRTTHRVLLTTHTLHVLNSVTYCTQTATPATTHATTAQPALSVFLQRLLPPAQPLHTSHTPSVIYDAVLSVAWLGAALTYTCESGAVHYLLPGPCMGEVEAQVRRLGAASSVLHRSAGLRVPSLRRAPTSSGSRNNSVSANEASKGLLLTLPRNTSTSLPTSHRVVSVLSDRALLCYLRRDDAYHSVTTLPQLAFTQRPLNPVEPLVLGLMALHYLRTTTHTSAYSSAYTTNNVVHSKYTQDAITTLLQYYISPRRDPSAGQAAGARPTAHLSRKLTLALAHYTPASTATPDTPTRHAGPITNLSVVEDAPSAIASAALYASVVAGLCSSTSTSASTNSREFPTARWVTPGFKFYTALQARQAKQAALEVVSSRSELTELLVEHDAYGGSAVPHIHRPLSAQLSASAVLFYLHAAMHGGVSSGSSVGGVSGGVNGVNSATAAAMKELSGLHSTIAHKLLDIAGDYASLSALLLAESGVSSGASSNSSAIDSAKLAEAQRLLELVSHTDRAAYLALHHKFHTLQRDWTAHTVHRAVAYVLQGRLSLGSVGASYRHKHLVTPHSDVVDAHTTSTTQLTTYEALQREHAAHHQLGPPVVVCATATTTQLTLPVMGPRCGGMLAMDLLEDYMGINLQLELSSVSSADLFNTGGSSDNYNDTTSSVQGGMYLGQALPSTWVEGVGSGSKEHELIVGYWRFSDVAYQTEEGYHNTALPPLAARLTFLDLSRFEGPGMELYSSVGNSSGTSGVSGNNSGMRVDASTSPLDPGEKHENVKSLCDVVYLSTDTDINSTNTTSTTQNSDFASFGGSDPFAPTVDVQSQSQQLRRGLRCPVSRGAQLDIGLYHEDSHRNKMTLELSVNFDDALVNPNPSSNPSTYNTPKYHVLAQRVADSSSDGSSGNASGGDSGSVVLWTLYVSSDGEVCFVFGKEGSAGLTVIKSAADSVALPSRQGSGGIADIGGGSGVWTHIALIIDSSKSTVTHNSGTLTQTPASVTLCVKGDTVDAKIAPPTVQSALLLHSTLYIGSDLSAGWRLTELRLWAENRSLSDLESMRENYLVMAMKRKRLQLRVKGTKKLFTAYREIEVPAVVNGAIKLPVAAGGTGEEESGTTNTASTGNSTASSSTSAATGSKPLVALGKPLLGGVAPLKPLRQAQAEKTDPATASTAGSTSTTSQAGATDTAATSTTTNTSTTTTTTTTTTTAPAMSARERRLSQLKSGGALNTSISAMNTTTTAHIAVPGALTGPKAVVIDASHTDSSTNNPSTNTTSSANTAASTSSTTPITPSVSFAAFDAFPESPTSTTHTTTAHAHAHVSFAPTVTHKPSFAPTNPASHTPAPLSTGGGSSKSAPTSPLPLSQTPVVVPATIYQQRRTLGESYGSEGSCVGTSTTTSSTTSSRGAAGGGVYEWETHCTAKPLAVPQYWLQCLVPAKGGNNSTSGSTSGGTSGGGGGGVTRGLHCLPLTTANATEHTPCTALTAEVRLSAESCITTTIPSTNTSSTGSKTHRVAVLSKQVISVYTTTTTTAELSAQVSLASVKLLFWCFISPEIILLVTSSAGFTLKVAGPNPGGTTSGVLTPRPSKIFDRVDLRDRNSWKDRAILDLQVCADGWTLLLTGSSNTPTATSTSSASDRTLTLYHARSGRALSFAAAGGCFRFGLPQVLVVYEDVNPITKAAVWCVTAIDLADITRYWDSQGVPVVAPGTTTANTNAVYKEPLSLHTVPASLHIQWSLQLLNHDTHGLDAQRDLVASAALDQTSDAALPCLRVVSRHRGAVVDVSLKSFAKGLTQPGGVSVSVESDDMSSVEAGVVARGDCVFSSHLPRMPVHVWSIGKLVYVLTERGELHQAGVGGVVPLYVGSASLPLPSGARPLPVSEVPEVAQEAVSAVPVPVVTTTTSTAKVVRNWTDNPGFKKLAKAPTPSTTPPASPSPTLSPSTVVEEEAQGDKPFAATTAEPVPVSVPAAAADSSTSTATATTTFTSTSAVDLDFTPTVAPAGAFDNQKRKQKESEEENFTPTAAASFTASQSASVEQQPPVQAALAQEQSAADAAKEENSVVAQEPVPAPETEPEPELEPVSVQGQEQEQENEEQSVSTTESAAEAEARVTVVKDEKEDGKREEKKDSANVPLADKEEEEKEVNVEGPESAEQTDMSLSMVDVATDVVQAAEERVGAGVEVEERRASGGDEGSTVDPSATTASAESGISAAGDGDGGVDEGESRAEGNGDGGGEGLREGEGSDVSSVVSLEMASTSNEEE